MNSFRVPIDQECQVSALLSKPADPVACFVFAHGASAGMTHPFMEKMANALSARRVACLRYQFPYMEGRSKRPDPPAVAQITVRAAANAARQRCPDLPLIAGGKSFGGRMTSQAQAASPLPYVIGLVFFGFPLHPAGKPSVQRASHLFDVKIPMLFVQGSKDKLAEPALIGDVTHKLSSKARLHIIKEADHSLHVPARSGRTDDDVIAETADIVVEWLIERSAAT
jgi:predicted alpha/beta-hydrolase family hydrolase